MARRHFKRRGRGQTVVATLDPTEASILGQLCQELGAVIRAEVQGDPVIDRLYPRAYLDPTEEQAEEDWQRHVHDDLAAARRRSLDLVEATLSAASEEKGRLRAELSLEEAEAWLSVLNDARLTLGIRLEVTEETDPISIPSDDPRAPAYGVYWWLGLLEEGLVAELMG